MALKKGSFGKNYETMEVANCCKCGGDVFTWKVQEHLNYKCNACKVIEKQAKKEKRKNLRELEQERKLDIAIELFEKLGMSKDYTGSIEILRKHLYKDGYFQSSLEVITALELLRRGYKFKHQVKIGKWKVDFVIPILKTVLEVDGDLYHSKDNKEKEQYRDSVIVASLGPEWEVIRIKESTIKKNPQKLVQAIKMVITRRRKLRKNYSYVPSWYNDVHK